ncbi:YGGT family protein [Legionella massiliensis]|uniref:YGGT family protein n=1 Tax=Legionella massiliensis TaxID=1034943 RepID=A0A078KX90_9GAMM|nr:YggT family protein [Legionella massiliensis]CDZ77672.1 YGGT family protein [Legionella massiliensis]CEE13410.1 YGGT family protein [Legionella massiliensis]
MSGFIAVGHFLVSMFFSLLFLLLWARMFLRYYKISPLHSVSQSVNSLTDAFVKPISDKLPTKSTQPSRYDWACLTVIVIAEIIKYLLIGFILYKTLMPLGYLFLFVITDLVSQPCNLLFYLILIRVIMSWVKPDWKHPAEEVIRTITDPVLALGRSILPEISGFDFSPLLVLIILKAITLFMSASLPVRLV